MSANSFNLFSEEQSRQINQLVGSLNDRQLSWLAGYIAGIFGKENSIVNSNPQIIENTNEQEKPVISVLFGSRTGNGAGIAKKVKSDAEKLGLNVSLLDMSDYQPNKIKEVKNLLVIVSTHGEGEPPIAAEEFYSYLFSKKVSNLKSLNYSVLALGDKSYVHFCKTGKDIDERLAELGANRMLERVDCDVDFQHPAQEWITSALNKFAENQGSSGSVINTNNINTSEPAEYNRQNPFKAKLLEKVRLTGRGSNKETFHYSISLEGSGLSYEPGDAIGVFGINSEVSVNELIEKLSLKPDELVNVGNDSKTLKDVLTRNFEISTLSPEVVNNFNKIIPNHEIENLLKDPVQLKKFLYGKDVLDYLNAYPLKLNAQQLVDNLRKLQPRLYSISSSSKAFPDEVHLTVSAVRYNNGRYKEGVCSTYLADRVGDEEFVRIFIEKNPEFRLPPNPEAPVIMVGPGAGVAPFRAFLQERENSGSKGKNWLFFGEQHFVTDFLYQTELQNLHKKGVLTKLHVAFSRDTEKKVYVQHKMLEQSKELYNWLNEGAYFYVCGDMQNMWRDVNQTLIEIVSKHGGVTPEKAEEFVKKLKKDRRYLVDVY